MIQSIKSPFTELQEHGFTRIPGIVDAELINAFERTMDALATEQLAIKGVARTASEGLTDLLKIGGEYRVALFGMFKHLRILHRMSHQVGARLDTMGFFDWTDQTAPMFWPSLRADLPGEDTYLLPMHQDYASTKCHRAWRLWIPLRDANADSGTMTVVPGSHKLGHLEHDTSDPRLPYVPTNRYAHLQQEILELPAGDGVLFNPLLLHASVPPRGDRIKYVLLIQVQDLASLADPDDPRDQITRQMKIAAERDAARLADVGAAELEQTR